MGVHDDFARYLEQRIAIGERRVILEEETGGLDLTATQNARSPERVRPDDPAPPVGGSDTTTQPKWLDGAPEIPSPGITVEAPETHLFQQNPIATLGLDALVPVIQECRKCGLCEGRTHAVPGEGPANARLMVVGEGPGATEDETGRPFVGRAGQLLNDILAAIDCPRETVFIGNVVKCRPPNNRDPQPDEISQCLPYLNRQIELIHPSVILAMGRTAACTLLDTRNSLSSLRNKVHRYRGIPLIVTYHPAALLRNPHWKKPTWDDVRIARRIVGGQH